MNKILVTGAYGMLGRAVTQSLNKSNFNVIPITRNEVDLVDQIATKKLLEKLSPDAIVHCAALVGGIQANISGGGKFLLQNLAIDNSVLISAKELEIRDLVYIGSSCMYPANRDYALTEDQILTGPLEKTNENYALAKIIGSRIVEAMAQEFQLNWRTFVASNLYGPYDHFGSDKSHLLPAIITKAIEAKKNNAIVEMWGDGRPRREFTYVEDFSDWIAFSMNKLERLPQNLNVGIGTDHTVQEYYSIVLNAIDYQTEIVSNPNKPSGNMRKLMDSNKARKYGWNPKTSIEEGISKTITWYLSNMVAS
jgi:GDP-L-fucose synthase